MLVGKLVEVFLSPIPRFDCPETMRGTIADQVGPSTYLLTNVSSIQQVVGPQNRRLPDECRPLGRDVVFDTQSGTFHHIEILPAESKASE